MILRFAYRPYSVAFSSPVRTAHGPWTTREGILVRIADESGRAAIAEAAPIPWFGTETVTAAEEVCRGLGEWVEAEALAALPESLPCLRGAVNQAVVEVRAQVVAEMAGPVALSAQEPGYLPVAALLPAGRAALALVEPRAEAGFRTFKWKVGVGDPADELAMLDDLIGRLPSTGRLRLDANGAWDRRRAERWLERCADRPVDFVEQPIAPDARGAQDLLLGLAGDYPTPLGLDESLVTARDVEFWIGAGWPGVFVVKPTLWADPEEQLKKLARAKARVVFSSAMETAVGARRALRLAFAWSGQPQALGFGVWPLFADARFDGPHVAPFIRREDVERLDPEAVWNAAAS